MDRREKFGLKKDALCKKRFPLAHDYKLAGLAFWRYGFETEDIYDQIEGAFLNKKDESVRYKNRSEDILIKFRRG